MIISSSAKWHKSHFAPKIVTLFERFGAKWAKPY